MRYIKKFNEEILIPKTDEFYSYQKFSIVRDEVYLYDSNGTLIKKIDLENFSKLEIEEIDKIMISKFFCKKRNVNWPGRDFMDSAKKHDLDRLSILFYDFPIDVVQYPNEYSFTLCKAIDEWYFIALRKIDTSQYYYYKCDQFVGLINLLKDLPKL